MSLAFREVTGIGEYLTRTSRSANGLSLLIVNFPTTLHVQLVEHDNKRRTNYINSAPFKVPRRLVADGSDSSEPHGPEDLWECSHHFVWRL